MRDVTYSEWQDEAKAISAEVQARWPWLHSPYAHGGLRVETRVLAASLDLRHVDGAMVPAMSIGSSACITGGAADVAEAARQICEVRDVMLYVHGRVSGLRVWSDGECPCSHCSGTGKGRGRPCDRCGGSGRR